jgi:anaerobic magnesium-protoporphyrin IX monomethyl ester cyclase
MRVMLTHGYFIKDDPKESGIIKPYPPQGLLYLSAWLNKYNISNIVFDTTFSDMIKIKAFLEKNVPEIIGFYTTLMTKLNILEIIRFIRENHIFNESKIIIGGPDARYNSENYLTHGVDIIVPGEGEETLVEIVRVLSSQNKENIQEIKGIIFIDKHGKIFNTGERERLDLDKVPFPAYESIDMSEYIQKWTEFHGFSSVAINSMRGCPFSCNWCSKSVFGNSYRRRNPISVVQEMIFLKNKYKPDQVWFTDDVFTLSKEWLWKFNEEIKKKNMVLPYECITRPDCLNEEVIRLMKESGCRKVWIGAESGSEKVIDLMKRKIDLNWMEEMIIRLKSLGISIGTFIMVGYIGEEKKDIFKTASFLKRILPEDLTFGIAYPIKGTNYFERAEPLFDHPYDWNLGNEREIRYKKPFSDRFYRFTIRYLFNEVAFKKADPGFRKLLFFLKAIISKTYILLFD